MYINRNLLLCTPCEKRRNLVLFPSWKGTGYVHAHMYVLALLHLWFKYMAPTSGRDTSATYSFLDLLHCIAPGDTARLPYRFRGVQCVWL